MFAIAAAVLFGLALLFKLLGVTVAFFTVDFFLLAGLLCVGLYFAGVGGGGGTVRVRGYTRRKNY